MQFIFCTSLSLSACLTYEMVKGSSRLQGIYKFSMSVCMTVHELCICQIKMLHACMHAAAHILGDNGEACMQLYNILTDYHNYSMIVLHVSMKMMLMQSDILWLYILYNIILCMIV